MKESLKTRKAINEDFAHEPLLPTSLTLDRNVMLAFASIAYIIIGLAVFGSAAADFDKRVCLNTNQSIACIGDRWDPIAGRLWPFIKGAFWPVTLVLNTSIAVFK